MYNFENIPKIIHFFWEGKLSFLRYISILSFKKFNTDWEVNVHTSINSSFDKSWNSLEYSAYKIENDYFDLLKKDSSINLIEHNFEIFGLSNNIHPVHKSDLLRWYLLSTTGGVWSDADIIYLNSINTIKENIYDNRNADTVLCRFNNEKAHAIGFLMSKAKNPFWSLIFTNALFNYKPEKYQSIGNHLLKNYNKISDFNNLNINPIFLDENFIYSIKFGNLSKLLSTDIGVEIFDNTLGCHWFGGDPLINKTESLLNADNLMSDNSLLSKLICKII